MPKMKTHTATSKRFKKNKNGKIKHSKAYKRHHAWAKGSKKGRKLRKESFLEGANRRNISTLLPYN
jgi:large subunit ribosomal protein L35